MEVYCQLPVVTCSALTDVDTDGGVLSVTCSALTDVDTDGGVLSVTCGYL